VAFVHCLFSLCQAGESDGENGYRRRWRLSKTIALEQWVKKSMSSIVTFVGWHDSGKTTLVTQVVAELKGLGYSVAVIKSSNDSGIVFDNPGTDTFKHRQAGADSVMLVAPDQTVLRTGSSRLSLRMLARRYFPDVDIVIGEGFKTAKKVPKIEVLRNRDQKMADEIQGIIAIVSDLDEVEGSTLFGFHQAKEIALFIEKRFLRRRPKIETASLMVNGRKIPIKGFVQEALAGTVKGFVDTLKLHEEITEIKLQIRVDDGP
jgi:molybdopterin-guanine dinucleotide biosynthesis adapter protein